MAIELMEEFDHDIPRVLIKVIGVGGGGCNAVHQMMDFNLEGVELINANTDMQVLQKSPIQKKLQLGVETTRGLGAGSKPEVGRLAAEEDKDRIEEMLRGADMVFIAAGMGGGTGTGAAPVIASIARKLGVLSVAIVTKPFTFEGAQRMHKAEKGIDELKKEVDCLIVIPNDRISAVMGEEETLLGSFKAVDNVLKEGVLNLAKIIQYAGFINTDLEDVKTIMSERGVAMMGTGEAQGDDRAQVAADRAISSPLLENIDLTKARGLLVNVSASSSFKQSEYNTIGGFVEKLIDTERASVKIGLLIDDDLEDTLRVTVLATGLDNEAESEDYMDIAADFSAGSEAAAEHKSDKKDDYIGIDIPSILRRKTR